MLSLISLLVAASLPLHFSHIGIEEGLSNNSIIDLCEDSAGDLWVATRNGLNRYDGYDFITYNQQGDIPGSIFTDAPLRISTDSEGTLWVASYNGLSQYDRNSDSFTNYRFEVGSMVSDMLPLDNGLILLCCGKGMRVFDKGNGAFIAPERYASLENISVNCMTLSEGRVLIGCDDGIKALDPDSFEMTPVWAGGSVVKLCKAGDGRIWIGTENDGVWSYSPETGVGKHLTKQSCGLNSNYIKDLATDSEGALWIGTFSGLNICDENGTPISSVSYSPDDKDGLTQAYVNCLMCDSQGGMWTGTYYGGLNYYHPLRDRFAGESKLESLNRLSDHIFNSIVEDDDNDLWIGTDIGDIIHYDSKSQRYSSFYFHGGAPDKIPFTEIKSIITTDKYVYVCAYAGGMLIYDKKDGKRTYYNQSLGNLPSSKIYSLCQARGGGLWIATLDGMYHFNPENGNVTGVHTDKGGKQIPSFCRVLFKDSAGRLWIGAKGGCMVYMDDGESLSECEDTSLPEEIQRQHVNCFFERKDGVICIGTSDGLYEYFEDGEDITFNHINDNGGLSNSVVKAINEDDCGRLWISTYNGLNTLTLNDGTVRRYYVADGLPSNQFLARSCCRMHDGKILFGSVKGIVSIDPERVRDNPYTPKPVFDYLSSGGERINIIDGKVALAQGQRDFMVKFAARDFVSGKKNSYAYMLEGHDRDWIYQEGNASLSYTEVAPGRHRLIMKACNSDGIWNDDPSELEIIISKKWYESPLFMATVILALLAIAALFWRRAWLKKANAPLVISSKDGADRYTVKNVRENFITEENRKFLEDVVRIIEDGIADYDFSTEMIAMKMNMSRTGLHNRLKEITGESAINLISEVRFSKAKRLLEDGNHSIAEVSSLCGFRTQAYFAARFKKEFGSTPSEYLGKNK